MLWNYDKDPCMFRADRVAYIVAAVFSTDFNQEIVEALTALLDSYRNAPKLTPQILKDMKAYGLQQIKEFMKTGKCSNPSFQKIVDLEACKERAANMLMLAARWSEWYIYTEKGLSYINKNIEKFKDQINAITYYKGEHIYENRICPYDPESKLNDLDLNSVLYSQEKHVLDYLKREGINSHGIRAKDIIRTIEEIFRDYNDPLFIPDSLERGFYNSIIQIRSKMDKVAEEIRLYKAGEGSAHSFSRSESRSVISEYDSVITQLNALGYNRRSIPNVVANLYHCEFPRLKLRQHAGQIQLKGLNAEYFDVAAGLGPALKIRFVYNVCVEIQNLLSPLADCYKASDRAFDRMEAYLDQLGGITAELPNIKDAYCTDATGYSDYLWRGFYVTCMQLAGVPSDIILDIMHIFRMPIKIGAEFHEVKFGALQGCKFLVFVMNHANRLIGIIAKRLGIDITSRYNAGDDVVAASWDSKFTQKDIDIEFTIFAFLNSPSNPMKSAWLSRDGYFDFCSKYFGMIDGRMCSIGGIPPKLIGKQFGSISSFTEIFRILDLTHTDYNAIELCWERCLPIIKEELEAGCLLPNAMKEEWDLDSKIAVAKEWHYSLGGLSTDKERDGIHYASHALEVLERILKHYRFSPVGLFLLMQRLDIQGTALYEALGSVENQSARDIVDCIVKLKNARDTGLEPVEEIKKAREIINRMERNILKGLSISSNSSTYHRNTITKDIDCFTKPKPQYETSLIDQFDKPSDSLQYVAFVSSWGDERFCDIDKLRNYMQLTLINDKYRDRIYAKTYGIHLNYYITDDDGKVIKLTSYDRNKADLFNDSGQFKHPDQIINPEIRYYYDAINGDVDQIFSALSRSAESATNVCMAEAYKLTRELAKEAAVKVGYSAGEKIAKRIVGQRIGINLK